MRLKDVDDEERDFAVVIVEELVEGGNLPPEGWSSVAAEHEHYGRVGGEGGQLDAVGLVEFEE